MTALDQAFIKAFSQQDTFPLAVSPRAAAPANDVTTNDSEERETRNRRTRAGHFSAQWRGEWRGARVQASGFRCGGKQGWQIPNPKSQISSLKSPNPSCPISRFRTGYGPRWKGRPRERLAREDQKETRSEKRRMTWHPQNAPRLRSREESRRFRPRRTQPAGVLPTSIF